MYGGKTMKNKEYRPEGIFDSEDSVYLSSLGGINKAMNEGKILQAKCYMCDSEHNLHLKFNNIKAIIPRKYAAIGIIENNVKDVAIITRVNKSVSFKVLSVIEENGAPLVILSRRDAQLECLEYIMNEFKPGKIIDARITHLEQFGAFADVGCGIVSMISIDNISVSRIQHPSDRFYPGMNIKAVVKGIDKESGRVFLSHKELLGTWMENARKFTSGQTVSGIVRSIESYGIFIELTPNLAGLAELTQGISVGDKVSVYIKSIIPEKMKVKLAIVDISHDQDEDENFEYMYTQENMLCWRYSPECCPRVIESDFAKSVVLDK